MFKNPIVTKIRQAAPFFEAEEYHQHFYRFSQEDSFLKEREGSQLSE